MTTFGEAFREDAIAFAGDALTGIQVKSVAYYEGGCCEQPILEFRHDPLPRSRREWTEVRFECMRDLLEFIYRRRGVIE